MKTSILAAALLATGLGGCAVAPNQQHEHPDLMQRIEAAEKAASNAQAAAIRAQARADEAAAMAAANNDKIDKAFRKSQQK